MAEIRINGRLVGKTGQQAVGKTGQQLPPPVAVRRRRAPEAQHVAQLVGEYLVNRFGDEEWIAQAADGVEILIQRCIEQFLGRPTPQNAGPIVSGSDYTHLPRTAEEIKETMAAEQHHASAARRVPRYRVTPDEIHIPEEELADPMQHRAPTIATPEKKDWLL